MDANFGVKMNASDRLACCTQPHLQQTGLRPEGTGREVPSWATVKAARSAKAPGCGNNGAAYRVRNVSTQDHSGQKETPRPLFLDLLCSLSSYRKGQLWRFSSPCRRRYHQPCSQSERAWWIVSSTTRTRCRRAIGCTPASTAAIPRAIGPGPAT